MTRTVLAALLLLTATPSLAGQASIAYVRVTGLDVTGCALLDVRPHRREMPHHPHADGVLPHRVPDSRIRLNLRVDHGSRAVNNWIVSLGRTE
jgi:hypothetical protein